jgi:hypothetical protein
MQNSDENLVRLEKQIRDGIRRVRDSIQRTKELLSTCGRQRPEPAKASPAGQSKNARKHSPDRR